MAVKAPTVHQSKVRCLRRLLFCTQSRCRCRLTGQYCSSALSLSAERRKSAAAASTDCSACNNNNNNKTSDLAAHDATRKENFPKENGPACSRRCAGSDVPAAGAGAAATANPIWPSNRPGPPAGAPGPAIRYRPINPSIRSTTAVTKSRIKGLT